MEADGIDLSGVLPNLPETISFRASGREFQVNYLDRSGRVRMIENATRLMVSGPMGNPLLILEKLRKFTVTKARERILPLLDAMSQRTGLEYTAMRVRRQKTRWGSCSGRGTISVNAKLLFLPIELVNHLLLHELCHTKQLNHSAKYWALVEKYEPEFIRLENELKQGGKFVPSWFA
jgi:predicted metal-dependent hydrolase